MRNFYSSIILLFFIFLLSNPSLGQQTGYPNTPISSEINGYYVALPNDYNSTSKTYPLLIVLQGYSQMGDGTPSQLPYVLGGWGTPPYRLDHGSFPSSFTVNSETYKFIVFTPQFKIPAAYQNPYLLDSANGFPGTDITAVIDYCKNNYRVNTDRIYLSGNSLGGAQVWSYLFSSKENAKKIAAAVIISGASFPTQGRADVVASADVPVLATSASIDDGIPPSWTFNWIDYVNGSVPSTQTPAKKIIFTVPSSDHSIASENTYDPSYKLIDNQNMFQWLLLSSREIPLPISAINLNLAAQKKGIEITWTTSSELNNSGFSIEYSANGLDFQTLKFVPSHGNSNTASDYSFLYENPVSGKNYFRLKQQNKDNSFSFSAIKMIDFHKAAVLSIFPNPVKEELHINAAIQFSNAHLEIRAMNGKVVKAQDISGDNPVISVKNLSKGMYQCSLVQDKEVYSFTFVKQ